MTAGTAGGRCRGLGALAVGGLALAAGVLQPTTVLAQSIAIRVDDSSVWVAENGGTYVQEVWLSHAPTGNVTVQIASGDTLAVTLSPKTLTFTQTDFGTKQRVTYTGVDDAILNNPPAHRSATVTYTATGGGYDGISHSVAISAFDDEPIGFGVQEGLRYNLNAAYLVEQGCAPAVIEFVASDTDLLSLSPPSLSWNEQDSGKPKTVKATFHHNNALGEHRISLERRVTVPCGRPFPFQEIVFVVSDNDTPGAIVTPTELTIEERATDGYTVALTARPTADVTISVVSGSPGVATVDPPSLTFTPSNWDTAQPVTVSAVETGTATLSQRASGGGYDTAEIDDVAVTVVDPRNLSVDASPVCGTTVTDTSIQPVYTLRLKPAPGEEVATEYRWVTESSAGRWVGALSIGPSGRSIELPPDIRFAQLRQNFPGLRGFEFRLRDDHDVTAQCIWDFDEEGTTPTLPTVRLSVSPNPVDEGYPVTVTATLSEALSSGVTIPLTLTAGTAEAGDFGSLPSITIAAGSTSGTGTITTAEDADTDDETFTVALGTLPSSVTAGSPSSVEVTIRDTTPLNRPPIVTASCEPCRVGPGGEVRLTATGSDPDGDPLTFAWSAPRGGFAGPADEPVTRWRAPADTGRVTIRVRVADGRGGTASATVSVEVANAPPAFGRPSYTFELRENEDGRFRAVPLGGVVAEDPDGDAVTYALATGAADLFAVGSRDGAVTYVGPGEDYETEPNRYELTVSARDPHGAEARVPVVVGAVNVNEAPEAAADTAATAEDERVVIDVLANDTDVEGDALRVESVSRPAHGTARAAADGGVEYAPVADYHGEDRFTYAVADGNGGTAEAEVVVAVASVNDAPVAEADTAATAEDEPVLIDVLANDTDVDGDALRIDSFSQPAHGRVQAAGVGVVGYAPDANYHGEDRFTYAVADGNGGTAEAEVVVAVTSVNDAPVAEADTAATAEDEPVLIDVLANDTDVEGDALRIDSFSQPAHGRVQAAGVGVVGYAPDANYHGEDRFTYTVADGKGGTAEAEVFVAVASVNDAPLAVGSIPDQALEEGGEPTALDLAPYFEDPDGDSLTYAAVSSDPGVASVAVTGSVLTLTPAGYGPASVVVTARDPGGLSAAQTFAVDASDRMVRAVLDETLAAMARAHLASARMTLGRWVGPVGADERSRLTVGGRSIPLDGAGVRQAAERLLAGWTASRYLRGGGLAEAGRGVERQVADWVADAAEGRGAGAPWEPTNLAAALGLNGLGGPAGLGASGSGTEFVFAWGGGEAGAQEAGGSRGWRLWGQGDLQTFAGDPAPERGYEGDLRTGWAGLDRALGERWLAGVAVARSRGVGDWRAGTAGGRLETSLTAVHPYLRWSDGAMSVWAMAGGGRGSAQNARATGRVGESGLDLGLGIVEVRRRFADGFGLRADAAWARLATGAGTETVDGRSAAVHQQRLGFELAPSTRVGALSLEVFGEASARRDGGAGQTGSGLEMAGGLRAAGGPVRIDAQGRILVFHSAEGYEERGVGVTLSVGSPSADEGLSLSVSPRWGGPTAASGALWEERLGGVIGPQDSAADRPWSLEARGRYALRLPRGRLLAWSGGLSRSAGGWGLTIGGGIETAPPGQRAEGGGGGEWPPPEGGATGRLGHRLIRLVDFASGRRLQVRRWPVETDSFRLLTVDTMVGKAPAVCINN